MPPSFSAIKIGQKQIRAFCGHLILQSCGKNVNVEKNASFDSSVRIGNNSGLGINCRIGPQVTIGDNVIIGNGVILGAGSVVRRDVPDYAVVIGNPAEIVKFRKKNGEDSGELK